MKKIMLGERVVRQQQQEQEQEREKMGQDGA
jgi:hypothetical protein